MKLYRKEAFSAPAAEHGLVKSLVLWEAPVPGAEAPDRAIPLALLPPGVLSSVRL